MKKKLVALLVAALAIAVLSHFFLPSLIAKWATDSDRKAAGLQEKSVSLRDHKLVYLEGGQGEAILMVHGFTANKDHWTHFAKFITPTYRDAAHYLELLRKP